MKNNMLLLHFIINGFFLAYMLLECDGRPQRVNTISPQIWFTPFPLDQVNRGSFNISSCAIELMTCMEIIRPELICYSTYDQYRLHLPFTESSYFYHVQTLCPHMKHFCHDHYGLYDSYKYEFNMFEKTCLTYYEQQYTY